MTKSDLMVINGNVLTEKDMFGAIDNVLIQLNDTGDISKAIGIVNSLDRVDNVAGKVKAKLLWGMEIWWRRNKTDDFGDYVESMSTSGTKRITVLRYLNVWEHIEQEQIPKHIQARPMRELVPIANMLAQGFVPGKAEWARIDLCSNQSELGEAISKIKGTKRRKTARRIVMERDGSINLWKDDKKKYLGFLDVEEALVDEDIAKAIEYIMDGRITRR